MTTPKVICFLHTSKMFEQGPAYEETFKLMVDALVSDKAVLIIVHSVGKMTATSPEMTKEKLLEIVEKLFKIYREE